jgi:4-amino-4-deoxy-L-arabinose transferase-like glycosyltransferase
MKKALILTAIFVCAFAVRLAAMGDPTPAPGSDEDEYDKYAWNLAQGNGYRGPSPAYPDGQHLTSWRMPGPSALFALVYRAVGHRPAAAAAFNCLCSALTCIVLFFISAKLYGDAAGFISAGIYALWPHAIYLSPRLQSEPVYVLLLMLFVVQSFTVARKPSAGNIVVSGLLLGGSLYVRPHVLLLPFVVFWIGLVFWPSWKRMAAVSLVLVIAGLVLLPWVMRNYHVHGAFVPFTTQGGEALLLGGNRIIATDPRYYGYALGDARQIPEYKHAFDGLSEVERDQRARQLYVRWMGENRDKWWYLVESKFRRFWTPFLQQASLTNRAVMLLTWGPILVLFIVPFIVTCIGFLRWRDGRWMVHAAILSTLVNSLIFTGMVRYRFPVEGLAIVFAVGGCLWLWRLVFKVRAIPAGEPAADACLATDQVQLAAANASARAGG